MTVTAEAVRHALGEVHDPILDQSLVDLGMVQSVRVARRQVWVGLVLPSAHWPARDAVVRSVHDSIAALPGVAAVDVQTMDQPPWSPYRMAQTLKAPLGLPVVESPSSFASLAHPARGARRLLGRLLNR